MSDSLSKLIDAGPLGKTVTYQDQYSPELLVSIPRSLNRQRLALSSPLPFIGSDLWTGYEVSWLSPSGKPQVALLRFYVDAESRCIVESKSLKLYLNSFNQTVFSDLETVQTRMQEDLSQVVSGAVSLQLQLLSSNVGMSWQSFEGFCLDELDVSCQHYSVTPGLLAHRSEQVVQESAYTHLFKSNCLVTGQPDWASVVCHYRGQAIDFNSLLQYWVSFRQHNEFHEMCVERMFTDIMRQCQPETLCIQACFTRRGGLDISPWRATVGFAFEPVQHLVRQ